MVGRFKLKSTGIENARELLDDFLYSFEEEALSVQLALLTATVKLFITRPAKGQDLVLKILSWATKEADNPDLRDRGFLYWRLLSTDINEARRVVISGKQITQEPDENKDSATMDELVRSIGTLASVFHRLPD